MYFLGVCVNFFKKKWKIGPKTHKNEFIYLFIYLTAKVYTNESFSAKRPRKLIPANVFGATRLPRNFVPGVLSTVRNMCVPWGFYPLGHLSAGAFVRRGFYPLGLLSVGLFSAGLLSVGLLSPRLLSAPLQSHCTKIKAFRLQSVNMGNNDTFTPLILGVYSRGVF